MFVSGNSAPRDSEASGQRAPRKSHSAMQIMLIILGVLVVPIIVGHLFNRPVSQKTEIASYPVQPGDNARNDALVFYNLVHQTTTQCDLAGGFRALATLSVKMDGDPVSVYRAAKREDSACIETDENLKRLQIPQSLGRAAAQAFALTLDHCEAAYLYQWSAAHALANALNNGGKMEDVATFRDNDANSKAENSACYVGLKTDSALLGVTRSDLTPPPSSVDRSGTNNPANAESAAVTSVNTSGFQASSSGADDESATTANLTAYNYNDYPSERYSGPRVFPNFQGPQRQFRTYRTMISFAAKQGPVFAGSVAIAGFGCGTDCTMGYAIDLRNGSVLPLPVGGEANSDMVLDFNPQSRLLKAAWKGALKDASGNSGACAGFAYFEWTGSGFKTLKASSHSPVCE